MGAPGTGKTHALRTFVDAGLQVFIIFTEPGMEVLGDTDPEQVHWKYIPAANADWDTMLKQAKAVNQFDAATLQKMPGADKHKYSQFIDVLNACADFTCDRTGENFGPVDEFNSDKVFVFDSLSGLNIMCMDLVCGAKPLKTLPDWGIGMDHEQRFVNKLCLGTKCHFVLTAHLDKQADEVLGGFRLMAAALGRKLPQEMPRFFSDVIMTEREGNEFFWSTAKTAADCKARNLPWKDRQPPSFLPLITHWRQHR